jgi:hypothetical protein
VPRAFSEDEEIHGKSVEQLVAEKQSRRGPARLEGIDDAEALDGIVGKIVLQHLPEAGTWLDEAVFETFDEGSADLTETGEDIPGETAVVTPLLDQDKGQGPAEIGLPNPCDPVGEEEAISLSDRDTGEKIAAATDLPESGGDTAPRIVAPFRVIQDQIHPCRKGH